MTGSPARRRAEAPRRLPGRLLVITDRHQARRPVEEIAEAIGRSGAPWLLLRDKDLAASERSQLAGRLAAIARRHGTHFSISADVELAVALGASVHLQSAASVTAARARLGHRSLIGVSAHNQAELEAAAAANADYVTLSPIFPTTSKPGYGPALGPKAIAAAAELGLAVVALGGITAATAGACFAAGAGGIATMGEIMRADDPIRTIAALLRACAETTTAAPVEYSTLLP
jgi:thiamine-phosphate pyrophosphorylase